MAEVQRLLFVRLLAWVGMRLLISLSGPSQSVAHEKIK